MEGKVIESNILAMVSLITMGWFYLHEDDVGGAMKKAYAKFPLLKLCISQFLQKGLPKAYRGLEI